MARSPAFNKLLDRIAIVHAAIAQLEKSLSYNTATPQQIDQLFDGVRDSLDKMHEQFRKSQREKLQ